MKISVVITNYNYSRYLNRTLRSVFVQNYLVVSKDYEIIVVDDSSDDWSHEIIDSYGRLIRPIFLEENVGLAKARNIGIERAKGEYIVFVDGDDYIHRDLLYVESLFLDMNPDWQAVTVDYFLVNEKEEKIKRVSFSIEPLACGIMYRKDKLIEVGMFDETFRIYEDKDLEIRFRKQYEIHCIELPLYRYRKHGQSLSSNHKQGLEFINKLKEKHQLHLCGGD